MMAIAQKCSLHLNPLPGNWPAHLLAHKYIFWPLKFSCKMYSYKRFFLIQMSFHMSVYSGLFFCHLFHSDPIPASLMEEQCDWGVTVQTPSKSNFSFSLEPKVDRKKRITAEPAAAKASKQPQRTGSTKGQSEDRSSAKTQPPKKSKKPAIDAEGPTRTGTPDPNHKSLSDLTRKEMQEALPKIPPLPSFKLPEQKAMSFAEAVADFENFITFGPGRNVEIIRQYEDRDEVSTTFNRQHQNHVIEASAEASAEPCVKDEMDGIICSPEKSADPSTRYVPSTSRSDSSSSSESESEMETEQKTDASASSSLSSAPQLQNSHRKPQLPKPITEPKPSTASTSKQPFKSRQNAGKPQIKPPQHHYHPEIHVQHSKLELEKKRAGKAARADEGSQRRWRGREDEEYSEEEEKDLQDRWQAYYQAWDQYNRSSYYYHSPSTWLAAYRMNTVYMMEMMKH